MNIMYFTKYIENKHILHIIASIRFLFPFLVCSWSPSPHFCGEADHPYILATPASTPHGCLAVGIFQAGSAMLVFSVASCVFMSGL